MVNLTARPTPEYGQIALHLRATGHEVWVATLDLEGNVLWDNGQGEELLQDGPPPYAALLPDAKPTNILGQRLSQLAYIRRVRAMIRSLQPDVVHVNTSGLRLTCLIPLGLQQRTAFVLDFRQIGDRRVPTNLIVKVRNGIRSVTRRSAAIYCYDRSVYLHALGAKKGLGPEWERWGTVVPMGVDESFLEVVSKDNGQAAGLNKVRFIYIGSMVRHRKLDTIFMAIKAISEQRDDFEVHFLGRDKSEGYYPDLIEKLQIERYVSMLPLIPYDEVPQRLTEYDAALAYVPYEPTDWTHHPTLKVLEYKAVGIPIIASDVAPNYDSVQSAFNGILCANTAEDFADAMLQYIENPSLRNQMKQNAARVRSGLTWAEASKMYEELYMSILSAKRGEVLDNGKITEA